MFQPRQEMTPRTNNFMASRTESLAIYVFGSTQDSELQRTLLMTLEQHSYGYELQTDIARLSDLRHNRTNQQRLIIILSGVYSDDAIRQKLQSNNSEQQSSQKIHIYSYPDKKSSSGLKNISSLKQLVSICQQLKKQKQKHKSIRLAGVHSIDKSYSSSKNITKVKTDSHYQSIKYMRNNVYGLNQNDLYDKITEIFEKQTSMESFLDLSSAITNCKDPKDQKVLFVVPTNFNQQIVKILKKKSKDSFIDVMLIGPVNPSQYMLAKNIVLATNSPRKVYEFLKEKNMISPHIVTFMFEELIRSGKYESERKIEDQGWGRAHGQQEAVVSDFFHKITEPANQGSNDYELGSQKKAENKPKIKKIKSPTKSRPSQYTNNENDISIRVTEPHDQPIKQTEDYHTNKQGEKIRKSLERKGGESTSISSSPDIPYPPPAPTHHYPTAHDIRQYPMKQSKYRHPSMIIHETSDEYRGSNKESVVNIEADSKFTAQYNYPADQIAEKRIITMGNGEPEAYYLQSDSTIKEAKPQAESRTALNYNSSAANHVINGYSQGYQAHRQVFRKAEVTQPEEVRQQSTTSIRDTPNFKPIQRVGQSASYNYQATNQHYGENTIGARSSTYHPYTRIENNTQNISSPSNSTKNFVLPQRSSNIVSQATSHSRQGQQTSSSHTYHFNAAENHQGSNDANYGSPYKYNSATISNYQSYTSAYRPTENSQTNNPSSNYTSIHKYVSSNNSNGQPSVNAYTSSNSATPISTARNAASPRVQAKYNLDGYERIEVNGITMYRKKQAQSNQADRDSSPKVQRYEVSPRREAQIVRKQFTNRPQYQTTTSSNQNGTQRYVASSYYNSSPKYEREYYNSNSYQVGPISVTTQEKINSASHRTQTSTETTPKVEQQLPRGITYKSGGGQLKDKVDVQRYQYYEQRLEAPNIPSSRTLNDSNWMSKPSDLYSDGSILRRNNARFGIKLKKKETSEASVIESKLGSRIYTVRDLNKKMALTKKISGEQQLQHQEEQYIHVNPSLTGFHYLIQEQLKYLESKLTPIFTYHDKIDYFSCIEDLVQKCQEPMDCGFVLATEQQRMKLNPNLLPQDYYLVRIVERSPFLQLNQTLKIIQMDNLSRLPLAQKIILDKKLFQYIVYRPGNKDIEAVADKFRNSEFIVEKCEVEMTWEFIDSYFEEYPQLTRVYLLCRTEDVAEIKKAVLNYKQQNSAFQIASLRLICINTPASNRSKLLETYPFLTFLQSQEESGYKTIIAQVHQRDKQSTLLIKPDRLYLHESQSQLMKDIERQFPNRFEFYMYKNGSELPRKMLKRKGRGYSSYLVMHQSLVGEKISLQSYRRVFLMGRAKTIPSQVVRVIRNEELIQLLRD